MKKFKWTERQKRALRGSIKKWEKIVDGTGEDDGPDNCTCCKFYQETVKILCSSCPISIYVGDILCGNTPYMTYLLSPTRQLAKSELSFIKKVYKAGGGK